MIRKSENLMMEGLGISPGIVMGRVRLINRKKVEVSAREIREEDVEFEIKRFKEAVKKSKNICLISRKSM